MPAQATIKKSNDRMKNIIVGTAGHIDHGKTALVHALTGIDADRLKEEKERGISIDLGFAHLEQDGIRLGFVDVPGHERFVRNMLAGAAGIDIVLLVIAADESIKPQTREHFEICRLLALRSGVIALNKADLVDPDLLELARLEVAEYVHGSFLESAPVVAVSAKTGEGLQELRRTLIECARTARARDASGPFRLPIDRSFTLRGFGTIVTGTLASGTIRVEDEVEVLPSGRRLRVRSVQVHGAKTDSATAGQRTAVNLAGVEATELHRGMTLVPPGLFRTSPAVECRFELLPSALPLKHRAPVHFHSGTAEAEAEVRLLDSLQPLQPGATARIRLLLKEPLPLMPGDRFIVRMFSPVVTIGGGVILENTPPPRMRRLTVAGRLRTLETLDLRGRLALYAKETQPGISLREAVARTGVPPEALLAEASQADLVTLKDEETLLVPRERIQEAAQTLASRVEAFHRSDPLAPGMPRRQAGLSPMLLEAALAVSPQIVAEGEALRLESFRVRLKGDEDSALRKMESLFRDGGLTVPAEEDVLASSGLDARRAHAILQILLKQGSLVRVSPDLIYHADAVERLKDLLDGHRGQPFSVPEFKEWTGISRKYAIPLLEFLDRLRVTQRQADKRVVVRV
jgi:selenocysteine-specific elongation factor